MRYPVLLALFALLLPLPTEAEPPAAPDAGARQLAVPLAPDTATVAIRNYGLGFLPLDGRFSRFRGVLRYAPGDRANCSVMLTIEAASLAMGTDTVTAMVQGDGFLDATHYPTLVYQGTCAAGAAGAASAADAAGAAAAAGAAGGLDGRLTMHGVTRSLPLTLEWRGDEVIATGDLHRADWNMTGHPLIGGSTVRIRVTARLPGAAAPGPAPTGLTRSLR